MAAVSAPTEALAEGRGHFYGTKSEYRRILWGDMIALVITLGFYRFWVTTNIRRYLWSRTEIAGDQLDYTGEAHELLLGFLVLIVKLAEQLVDRRTYGRMEASRVAEQFSSIEDVWRRASVPIAMLRHIAAADGFAGLGLTRRQASWAIKGLRDEVLPLFAAADDRAGQLRPDASEPAVTLTPMTLGREVVEDYRSTGLSLRAHPVGFLRDQLQARGYQPCMALRGARNGSRIAAAGLVLVRQMPGSAKGVMFMTIEDEGANAVALSIALAWNLLLLREDGVGAPEVHDDVLALEALHDAGEQLALPVFELVLDDAALRLAHALDDVLLRRLRGDPPELLLRELRQQLVADRGVGVERRLRVLDRDVVRRIGDLVDDGLDLEELDLADVGVELGLDLVLETEGATRRREHGLFEGRHDDALVDALLLADLLDDA
jgi:hypothetical protein